MPVEFNSLTSEESHSKKNKTNITLFEFLDFLSVRRVYFCCSLEFVEPI